MKAASKKGGFLKCMAADQLKAFANRLRAFSDGFPRTAENIVRRHTEDIADLQAKQLAQGVNRLGRAINPPYKPYTIEQKKGKPGLAGVTTVVTFYSTGELYKKLTAIINSGKFTITADTFKFQKAEERSGVNTFGLNNASCVEFAENISYREAREEFEKQVIQK